MTIPKMKKYRLITTRLIHIPTESVHRPRHAQDMWSSCVTVGPGRNDRRPGDKGLSTKSLAYRQDGS